MHLLYSQNHHMILYDDFLHNYWHISIKTIYSTSLPLLYTLFLSNIQYIIYFFPLIVYYKNHQIYLKNTILIVFYNLIQHVADDL